MKTSSVTGYVKDSMGKPVADAIVMVVESPEPVNDIAAVTDSSGKFSLGHITSSGKYVLQVNYGDKTVRKSLEMPLGDSSLQIQLR